MGGCAALMVKQSLKAMRETGKYFLVLQTANQCTVLEFDRKEKAEAAAIEWKKSHYAIINGACFTVILEG